MQLAERAVARVRQNRRYLPFVLIGIAGALTTLFVLFPQLVGLASVVVSWVGGIVALAMSNWDATEKVVGRLLGHVNWAGSTVERLAIAAEMEGTINGARSQISSELADIMTHPARVRFVKERADLARLDDGEIVLSLGDPKHRAENLAIATLGYVSASTIRPARPYVDPRVLSAVDFSITKRILRATDGGALDYFFDRLWKPAVHEEPMLRDLCHEVETIERHGVLTRVLLAEYLDLGRRLFGMYPEEEDFEATREFLHRLYRIASKGETDELGDELYFSVGRLRVGVILVADSARVKEGPRPYVWRCRDDIRRGSTSLYLLARGNRNIKLLGEVVALMEPDGRVLAVDRSNYQIVTRFGLVNVEAARISVDQGARSEIGRFGLHAVMVPERPRRNAAAS